MRYPAARRERERERERERAGVPVRWDRPRNEVVTECSTHPEAPQGLVVLPGPCEAKEFMTLVVENESPLPITISEQDFLAVGVGEGEIPPLEAYSQIHAAQEEFSRGLKWKGKGKDEERMIDSLRKDRMIIIVIHKVPRFAACNLAELSAQWKGREPMTRSTTLTSEAGQIDHVADEASKRGV
jgi:hypothetical protein